MKVSLFKKIALAGSIFLAGCISSYPIQGTSATTTLRTQESRQENYECLKDNLGAYYTVDEYEKTLKKIAKEKPEISSLEEIGKSWHKRPIYALKISDKDEYIEGTTKKEPQILILAHQHAKELISGTVAIETAKYLTENYNLDERIKRYVDNNEIYIIPLANPDGLAIIEGSQKQVIDPEIAEEYLKDPLYMHNPFDPGKKVTEDTKMEETYWRKNARDNDGDGIILPYFDGVDLNRNYSTGWVKPIENCEGSSDYQGPAPFSEPETKAVKGLVESLDNLIIAIDLHSYQGLVTYPPGYKEGETKDEKLFKKIAEEMAKKQPHEKYDAIKVNELYGTPVKGIFTDWAYEEHGALSFMIEVYKKELDGSDPKITGFNPPNKQGIKKVIENVTPMLFYLFEISDNPQNF